MQKKNNERENTATLLLIYVEIYTSILSVKGR
jgi:hypothetical protein